MKKITYIVAFLAISILNSCQLVDVLDKKPPYQADLDGAITTAKAAELALTGVYSYLPQGGFSWIDQAAYAFRSGIMSKPTWHNSGNAVYYYERNWPILSSNVDTEWSAAYNIIKNANFLLTRLDDISDFAEGRKDKLKGELYFLKGFAYHRLLVRYTQFWDMNSKFGLLIREDLPAIGGDKKSRATVAESYNVVLDNLNQAIALAPDYSDSGYASKLAAKATKVKVLMDMGKYKECAELAEEVIKDATMEGSYDEVFSKANSSKEIIFCRKFGKTEITSSMTTRTDAIPSGLWGPTKTYIDLIGNDPRKNTIIGDSVLIKYSGVVDGKKENATFKKLSNESNDMPIIFLRTAEMYLLKGEAIMRDNGTIGDAWAPILSLRNRAGATSVTPTTKEKLEDAICNEWLIELGGENGSEWLAIRRVGIDKLISMNAQIKEAYDIKVKEGDSAAAAYLATLEYKRIFSIPSDEINSNPVEQNPGY